MHSRLNYLSIIMAAGLIIGLAGNALWAQCPQRITQEFKGEVYAGSSVSDLPLIAVLAGYAVGVCENNPISPENLIPCTSILDFNFQTGDHMLDAIRVRETWKGCVDDVLGIIQHTTPLPGQIPTPMTAGCDLGLSFEIGHIEAASSLYEFAIGNIALGKKITGTVTYCDVIRLTNATDEATMIEFPVSSVGSVIAAESFGNPDLTWGKAMIAVTGTIDGHLIHDSVSVESVAPIPEIAELNTNTRINIILAPGTTTINVHLDFRVMIETRAAGAGPICGSAMAGFDVPGSISIGKLSGASGSPLPEGLLIFSEMDSTLYADTRIIGACCLGDSCAVIDRRDCQAAGGTYLGQGSTCGDSTCTQASGPLAVPNGLTSEVVISGAPLYRNLTGIQPTCGRQVFVTNASHSGHVPALLRLDLDSLQLVNQTGTTVLGDPLSISLGSAFSNMGRNIIVADINANLNSGRVYDIDASSGIAQTVTEASPNGEYDPADAMVSPGGVFGEGYLILDTGGLFFTGGDPMIYRVNPDHSVEVLIWNHPLWHTNVYAVKMDYSQIPGFDGNVYILAGWNYYLPLGIGGVFKWNPTDGLSEFLPKGAFAAPTGLAIAPQGPFSGYMYVLDKPVGMIARVSPDADIDTLATGIPLASFCSDISFSLDGRTIYLTANDVIYGIHLAYEDTSLISPSQLTFLAVRQEQLPRSQEAVHRIVSIGCDWEATVDQPWLTVTPSSGHYDSDTLEISVTTTDLAVGSHYGTITLSDPYGSYSPVTLPVEYIIQEPSRLCRYLLAETIAGNSDSISVVLRDTASAVTLFARNLAWQQTIGTDKAAVLYQAFTIPDPEDTVSAYPLGFSFRLTPCGLQICRDTAAAFAILIDGVEQTLYTSEEAAGCPDCDSLGQPPVIICPAETLLVELDQPDTLKIPMAIANADRVLTSGSFWNDDTLFVPIPDDGRYALLPTAFNACGISQCPIIIQARVGCGFNCGDFDGNCRIDVTDVVFLINYIFVPGSPAPLPIDNGDADCDNQIRITDAVYLVNYIFSGGPMPCAACK